MLTTNHKRKEGIRPGQTFTLGNPSWGLATFLCLQTLADGSKVLYRTNKGVRDERNRYYIMGGPGRRGMRRDGDD